jgi:hypothetical protein
LKFAGVDGQTAWFCPDNLHLNLTYGNRLIEEVLHDPFHETAGIQKLCPPLKDRLPRFRRSARGFSAHLGACSSGAGRICPPGRRAPQHPYRLQNRL